MLTGHSAILSGNTPPQAVADIHNPTIIVREYNHAFDSLLPQPSQSS